MEATTTPTLRLISDRDRHVAFAPATVSAVPLTQPEFAALSDILAGADPEVAAGSAGVALSDLTDILSRLASGQPDCACAETEPSTEEPPSEPDTRLNRLVLHVSHDCNLRCKYCYAEGGAYGKSRGHMARETAVAAVNWAVAAFGGVANVQFFGGEPMLNPRLMVEICEYFKALKEAGRISELPTFSMVTNGVLGDGRFTEFLSRYGVKVTVSIDGPQEIHDALRGAGSFEKADAFVMRCLEAGDIEVDFECTYTSIHVDRGITVADLTDFFCDRYGSRVVHIAPVAAPPGTPLHIDPELKAEVYAEAARHTVRGLVAGDLRASSFAWRVLEALRNQEPMGAYCPAGSGTFAVDADGGLYPCFMFAGDERFRISTFGEAGAALDDRRTEVAELIRTCDKSQRPECAACWAAPLCSGCLGGDVIETGDVACRIGCDMIRAIAETVILEVASA